MEVEQMPIVYDKLFALMEKQGVKKIDLRNKYGLNPKTVDSLVKNKGVWAMFGAILSGVASALFDKQILAGYGMEPLFVQSWTNVYIALWLVLIIAVRAFLRRRAQAPAVPAFRWDWTLLAIAILITAADMLYFFALKDDGALLSVVSLLRRSSTIVTFVLGALIFRERRIGAKAAVLALMLCGVVLLALSSL